MFPFDHQMVMDGAQSRGKRFCRDEQHDKYCAIATLCRDILINILLPFSAKTLVWFKLVSKEFNDVISSPIFGITHGRTHHKDKQSLAPTGFYYNNSFSNTPEICSFSLSNPAQTIPNLTFFERMAYHSDRQLKIVQSCNGLLLCSLENASLQPQRVYFVCNPTTHAYTMLPELPPSKDSVSKSKTEQEICHPILALAFNPLQTYVYKVFAVRVVKQLARKCSCEILVYSSDNGCRLWRKCDCQFTISSKMKRIHHGVFHDDKMITWVCKTGFIHFNVEEENIIVVRKGTLRSSTWNGIIFFGEGIDGGLYLIKLKPGEGIKICQLRPETSSWEDRCTFSPQSEILKNPSVQETFSRYYLTQLNIFNMYQILAVGNGGKLLILAIPGMVLGYCQESCKSWVIQRTPQQPCTDFSFSCVTSFQFVETLFPV